MSDVATALPCPACTKAGRAVSLVAGAGLDGHACDTCGGIFLPLSGSERLLGELLALSRAALVDLAEGFGGRRFGCPGCRARMRCLVVRGVDVDLCFHCGGLWLEHGELERLSGGRYGAPAPKKPSLPVAPPQTATEVRLDGRPLWRRVVGSGVRGVGLAAVVVYLVAGIGPLAVAGVAAILAGTALRRRRTIDVFPRARRMLRSRAIMPTSPRDENAEHFDDDSVIVVRPHTHLGFARSTLVDGCGRPIAVISTGARHSVLMGAARMGKRLGIMVMVHRRLMPSTTTTSPTDGDAQRRLPSWLGHGSYTLRPMPAAPAFVAFELRRDGRPVGVIKNAVPTRGLHDAVFSLCFYVEVDGRAALRFHDDGAGNVIVIDGDARQLGCFARGLVPTYTAARSPLRSRAHPRLGRTALIDDTGRRTGTLHVDGDVAHVEIVVNDDDGQMASMLGLLLALVALAKAS